MRPRVEICGNIASGKTTLAKLLGRLGLKSILESFRSNPFWRAFYTNQARFSFETEVTFLLQHYHAIKRSAELPRSPVCDFSLTLDRAYAYVTLQKPNQLRVFSAIADEVATELGPPKALVYLMCPEEVLLRRIRKRRRSSEQGITTEFLSQLGNSIETQIEAIREAVSVIEIDSDRINFAHSRTGRKQALELVRSILS